MTLNIHPDCKSRLVEQLAEALAHARVNNKSFLNRRSLFPILPLESILPGSGQIRDNLEAFIGESPLFDFVYGKLSRELNEGEQYNPAYPDELLSENSKYSDLNSLSARLIDEFDSLPWKYCFTFQINGSIGKYVTDEITTITDDIRAIKSGTELVTNYPLESGIEERDRYLHGGGLLGGASPHNWSDESLYIQIYTEGFVGKFITTTPETYAIDTFKSLLGILIALRLIKVSSSYSSSVIKSRVYTHRLNSTWEIKDSIALDDDISKSINNLEYDDLDGSLDTDLKKQAVLRQRFNILGKALSHIESSEKLSLAGRWLFESYCGSNELLSFIQTTVCLEILLGDKAVSDQMGLGELLRNRCAYLIGKNHSQREEVLSDFKKIYDIRSKIVHRGKSQLKIHERSLFRKLQWMANRVIQEEIELIEKNA
jgi:hypothetical protein